MIWKKKLHVNARFCKSTNLIFQYEFVLNHLLEKCRFFTKHFSFITPILILKISAGIVKKYYYIHVYKIRISHGLS